MANRTYIFFREDGFYLLGLSGDTEAIHNAQNNPGTRRVEDALTKSPVWRAPDEPAHCPKCQRVGLQTDEVYHPSEWHCEHCEEDFKDTI